MLNIEDPVISRTEKFGSRPELENILTRCERCRERINTLYDSHCIDKNGNVFCCETCAMEHYGIKLVEV